MHNGRALLCVLFLTVSQVSYAETQDTLSPRGEITAIGDELRSRLTPLEARLLERVDSLDRELARSDSWRDPKVILPIVAAVIGWGVAIYQLIASRRQRTWELLLESLGWFEGGTQKRSIGIAVVETKWEHQKEFRGRWGSILVNQAIYLLTRRKDRDARHERANLYRIMELLTVHRDELQDFECSLLGESLCAYSPSGDEGLTGIDPSRLEMWRTQFPA